MLGPNALVRTISLAQSYQFNSEANKVQMGETAAAEIPIDFWSRF
jgi:hypothetical protein